MYVLARGSDHPETNLLLLHDDDELPEVPDEHESQFAATFTVDRLRGIDATLTRCARDRWLKVARVVIDALSLAGLPKTDDRYAALHVRRVIVLVESGVLEAQGDPRRPRFSEVRLARR